MGGAVPDLHETRHQIATRVREVMDATGTRQRSLAEHLGMRPSTICHRFIGRQAWRAEELVAVADYLGVQVCDLIPQPRGESARNT